MIDPRTPVIVSVAAASNRSDDHAAEPISFMAEVSNAALGGGAEELRSKIEMVRVVRGIWPYRDPGRAVADDLGLGFHVRTGLSSYGGNEVYELVGRTAQDIANGDLDVALVCAAETMRTRRRDRAAGRSSEYRTERADAAADEGGATDGRFDIFSDAEAAVGMHQPVNFYALAEVALRHALGESAPAHRKRVGALWARASEVAADNPDAWYQTARTGNEIATVAPDNRAVAYPYPKLMTANVNVDQAGAVIMCSAAAAEAAGIPRHAWVFVLSHTGANDTMLTTHRRDFVSSPAMAAAGPLALSLAGVGIDDCKHIDLYSCFPVAVQVAQRELGVPVDRPFTITGGLTFAGGPLNSYCMQALVRGVQLSAESPADPLLLTGNGGFLTKHSFVVLQGQPGAHSFRSERPQAQADAVASRGAAESIPDTATIEAYTAMYGRNGEIERATLSCLDESGARLWATTEDPVVLSDLTANDACGTDVALRPHDNGLIGVVT